MKLDIDYIKDILKTINDNEDSDTSSLGYLMEILTPESDITIKKLRLHLKLLCQSNFLESNHESFGFMDSGNSGDVVLITVVKFSLTMQGYKLLESLTNDTLKNKILSQIKELSISTIKQIPSLAIQALLSVK